MWNVKVVTSNAGTDTKNYHLSLRRWRLISEDEPVQLLLSRYEFRCLSCRYLPHTRAPFKIHTLQCIKLTVMSGQGLLWHQKEE